MILGGDDQRNGEKVTAGPNGMAETAVNSGGNRFYPSNEGTKANLVAALRIAYASSDANHAAYIDFEVSEGNLALPYDS